MRYWLLKSEPDCFSIDDLARSPGQTTYWDGVRNYQARNLIRDQIASGDLAFFYHSSCDVPAIVGICEVVRAAYPDWTAFDPKHEHFDARSKSETPSWFMIDVTLREKFKQPLALELLRSVPELAKMELLRRGSRLSVQPVREAEFRLIQRLALGKSRVKSK